MKTRNKTQLLGTRHLGAAAILAASFVPLVVACSSESEATPTRTINPTPITPDADVVVTDDAGADADPTCTASTTANPTELVDFLNACSGDECAPFDNARLPLYEPGKPLPPLP